MSKRRKRHQRLLLHISNSAGVPRCGARADGSRVIAEVPARSTFNLPWARPTRTVAYDPAADPSLCGRCVDLALHARLTSDSN